MSEKSRQELEQEIAELREALLGVMQKPHFSRRQLFHPRGSNFAQLAAGAVVVAVVVWLVLSVMR